MTVEEASSSPLRRSVRNRAPVDYSPIQASPSKKKTKESEKPLLEESAKKGATNWGRSWDISIWTTIGCIFMLAFCPFLVLYFWLSCNSFQCSIVDPVVYVMDHSFYELVANYFPKPTLFGMQLYFGWLAFQAILYVWLPGPIGYGQMTPAGHKLPYIVNGLAAWLLTHALYFAGSHYLDIFSASVCFPSWLLENNFCRLSPITGDH